MKTTKTVSLQDMIFRSMNVIRSHLHEMYTKEVNKIALNVDDKRVTQEDQTHTMAYGHITN